MPNKILVISPDEETNQTLCNDLCELGYLTTHNTVLTKLSSHKLCPNICLIDLQLSRDCNADQWQAWLRDCQKTHTACLAFDRSTHPDRSIIAEAEPLCDTLSDPHDLNLLAEKVHSLLTIHKLTRQLNTTRQQLDHYQKEFHDGLQSAANIQNSLVPKQQPRYHNLSYSWKYVPCKQVGGDLFNVVQLDENTIMTYLMDVSGHGISSAMVTVSVHQSLSEHTGQLVKKPKDKYPFYEISSPQSILQELEAEYPFERFEEFFTISYLLINPHTGLLRYSNAGHPPPLLIRCDGRAERLDAGGTIIGIGKLVEFEGGESRLTPGDRLFMYTDGITEHLDKEGKAYGEDRLLAQLQNQTATPLDEAIQNTLLALHEFGGSALPIDDITLIGMEFL